VPRVSAEAADIAGGDGNVTSSADNGGSYCVLMPAGHGSGHTSFVGQHQFFDYNGTRAYYAWGTNDGTLTGGIQFRRSSRMKSPRR
jgi:hypothetical protein